MTVNSMKRIYGHLVEAGMKPHPQLTFKRVGPGNYETMFYTPEDTEHLLTSMALNYLVSRSFAVHVNADNRPAYYAAHTRSLIQVGHGSILEVAETIVLNYEEQLAERAQT